MTSPHRSHGIALVTALLIVALASVAAVSLTTQQQLDIRRTGNLIDGDQAWAYATGGESWAKLILRRDLERTPGIDHLGEVWAQPLTPIKLPGGYMIGRISDAQAYFNLNNLVQGNEPNDDAVLQMRRLLILLELNPSLVDATVDWIDPDINVRLPNGAEDDYYSNLDRPYRTANQPMASVSELRLVKGVNEKIYQEILPYVTALPSTSGTATPINVNTATPQVLATLADGMDVDQGMALVKLRQGNPFKDVTTFTDALKVVASGVTVASGVSASTSTTYFDVHVETEIGYGRAALTSLLSRTEQEIQVVRRAQGVN